MRLFFAILITFPTISSFANPGYIVGQAECTPTDIRQTNPRIRNNPEMRNFFSTPRDQDSIGWCYAFAASDIMTAEIGTPVSALHTSIIFNLRSFDNRRSWAERFRASNGRFQEVYEGGWAKDAIEDIRRHQWVCTERNLPFDIDKPLQVKAMIDQLEAIKSSREILRASGTYTSDDHANTCEMISNAVSPFNLTSHQLLSIGDSLLTNNMNVTLDLLARSICTDKIEPIPQIRLKQVSKRDNNDKNRKKYMEELNRSLQSGKAIQLSYRPQVISTSGDGSHASIIIGRRWNNGKCEYNVRNSWGRSCASYLPGVECNRAEGSFWMSDEQLFQSSSSFTYAR